MSAEPKPPVLTVGPPPRMAKGENCGNCAYFDASAGSRRMIYGACRRWPTTPFPRMTQLDWCGEHARRETK